MKRHYELLSDRLSYGFLPPEHLVNQIDYSFLRNGNDKDKSYALEFFKLNVENYPKSANSYDSLGEAYEAINDTKNAIINYNKSIDINPSNEYTKTKIEELTRPDN